MNVAIATVGWGHWYPAGVRRLAAEFARVSPGYAMLTYADVLPPGSPTCMTQDGWDYLGYAAKPFALKAAMDAGADIGILLDASFYPIRPIQPLVDYIAETGYYLCDNGYNVGEWANDAILKRYGVSRDEALKWPDASSYCVGLDFRRIECRVALGMWCKDSTDGVFCGPHTNIGHEGRNVGWCSDDKRCRGFRQDQSSISLIAYALGMTQFVPRPRFATYLGSEDESTVLVAQGLG